MIAFDKAHARQEMSLFGQDCSRTREKTKGLDDPAYKKARETSFRAAGPNGIDRLLKQYDVVALVGPTMPPAWKIDAVNGDQSSGSGAGSLGRRRRLSAPHRADGTGEGPAGRPQLHRAEMVGGAAAHLGYAYEQARGPFPQPKFYRSIEESPEIAPLSEAAALSGQLERSDRRAQSRR